MARLCLSRLLPLNPFHDDCARPALKGRADQNQDQINSQNAVALALSFPGIEAEASIF
jgi:hypothetical protein